MCEAYDGEFIEAGTDGTRTLKGEVEGSKVESRYVGGSMSCINSDTSNCARVDCLLALSNKAETYLSEHVGELAVEKSSCTCIETCCVGVSRTSAM